MRCHDTQNWWHWSPAWLMIDDEIQWWMLFMLKVPRMMMLLMVVMMTLLTPAGGWRTKPWWLVRASQKKARLAAMQEFLKPFHVCEQQWRWRHWFQECDSDKFLARGTVVGYCLLHPATMKANNKNIIQLYIHFYMLTPPRTYFFTFSLVFARKYELCKICILLLSYASPAHVPVSTTYWFYMRHERRMRVKLRCRLQRRIRAQKSGIATTLLHQMQMRKGLSKRWRWNQKPEVSQM